MGTAGGLTLGLIAVFGSFALEGGQVGALILLPAMAIVFGGTLATALIGNSMKTVRDVGKMIGIALLPPTYDVNGIIDDIVRYSMIARKEGLLTLEKEIDRVRDSFLRRFLRAVVDGTEPQSLKTLGEAELTYVAGRHARGAMLFQKMGGYSPTMGIIGTVMGLIATLAAAGGDPNDLIRHIAGAFIATLWGVFMANLVWLPIADKLRSVHADEELYREMIIEGMLALQGGEVPSVIKTRLMSMLPETEQRTRMT